MLTYIKGILPRIQKYSKELDKAQNFVDINWLLLDENNNYHSYEFCRDNRLIMCISKNGEQNTQIGRWELLGSGRMLIHRPDPILLDNSFLGDGLFIFKETNNDRLPFALYNPKIIPDGDVMEYLENFLKLSESIQIQNNILELSENKKKIYRNNDGSIFTGELPNEFGNGCINVIKNGFKVSEYYKNIFETEIGTITTKQRFISLESGDRVFNSDNEKLPTGNYVVKKSNSSINSISVNDGIIEGVIYKKDEVFAVFVITAIAIAIIVIFVIILANR